MTTTKIPKLTSLIAPLKFDYVNSNIVDGLFPDPKEISSDYKVFHFNKFISSEEVIKDMTVEGYRPAHAWELLGYAKEEWNNKDWVVALGSVGKVHGNRRVPYLDGDDSERRLSLGWFDCGWGSWRRNCPLKLRRLVFLTLGLLEL